MSSSRVHTSLTGCSTCLAMRTAWRMYSCIVPRRPKPPPSSMGWTMTLSSGMPAANRGRGERSGGVLRRRPDLDSVGPHMRGAGLRLHGRVGEKRHHVVRLDALCGAREARGDIAVGAADLACVASRPVAHEIADRRTRQLAVAAVVPGHAQRLYGVLARHQESATTATASGMRTMRRTPFIPRIDVVDRSQRAAKHRALHDGGVKHARQPHIDGVDRVAGDFVEHVETLARLAGERPVGGGS